MTKSTLVPYMAQFNMSHQILEAHQIKKPPLLYDLCLCTGLVKHVSLCKLHVNCPQKLQQILVTTQSSTIDLRLISTLSTSATCIDFDGELYFRGRPNYNLKQLKLKSQVQHWLPEAEALLKSLYISHQKVPDYLQETVRRPLRSLSELHLGTVRVTAGEICLILDSVPELRLLRHYQLVSALYMKHAEGWKEGKEGREGKIPTYKLLNLDADFSHVVRCRMSPQSVLPIDALSLAVALCPNAESVRIRYDCSTHHDSIEALTSLHKLKELSIVCVTSGERCLLDFTDIVPILEVHGEAQLKYLELKVIEEVDPHVIIKCCPKLRVLILSGCGFVTPDSCPYFQCGRGKPKYFLSRLKLLFYADGDDFSWDHSLPQCFWFATLLPDGKASHLRGLFLESPRIQDKTFKDLLNGCSQKCLLPEIQILSLCRYSELSFPHLTALTAGESLYYLRISQCDQFKESHMRRLKDLVNDDVMITYDLDVEESTSGGIRVGRAAK
ncbi:uncharacterized protein LOC103505595 [Diaphorina citri]|uniref:Uncharacterized protein LOC103505595 n=1 Tax=Diaphorina citri TaxID=121845 RepID=A0A3Q0IKJ4_DIACI|nr:uncharacterized protein LOC103505595 [Diaphorina citri]